MIIVWLNYKEKFQHTNGVIRSCKKNLKIPKG